MAVAGVEATTSCNHEIESRSPSPAGQTPQVAPASLLREIPEPPEEAP